MRKKSLWLTLLAIAMLLLFLAGPGFAETITFGIYTSDKPTAMYHKFKPIIELDQVIELMS